MANRNIDTGFFNSKFVRGLAPPYKALYTYLQLASDHGGIWQVDMDIARIITGHLDLCEEKAIEVLAPKVLVLRGSDQWFLTDFCLDQHKTNELNPCNTYHWGSIVILQRHALMDNDFFVLNEQMDKPCKPLYSSSKDAIIKIKGKNKKEIVDSITIDVEKTITVPKKEKNVDENKNTFVTPLVQAFREFSEMRVKIKKPMTERAKQMIHTELTKLAGDDDDLKIAILNQSVLNCWQDVYGLKTKDLVKSKQQPASRADNILSLASGVAYQEA